MMRAFDKILTFGTFTILTRLQHKFVVLCKEEGIRLLVQMTGIKQDPNRWHALCDGTLVDGQRQPPALLSPAPR